MTVKLLLPKYIIVYILASCTTCLFIEIFQRTLSFSAVVTWVVTAVLFCLVRVFFSKASAKVRRFFHSAKLFREKFRFLLKIFMLFDVSQRENRGLHYYIICMVCGCVGLWEYFSRNGVGGKMDGLSYKVSGCSNIVLSC